ncbi:MAG: hypothetical protein QXK14_02185 [Acidilobaceae archaeon]
MLESGQQMDVKSILASFALVLMATGFLGVSIVASLKPVAPPFLAEGSSISQTSQKLTIALVLQLALLLISIIAWSFAINIEEEKE